MDLDLDTFLTAVYVIVDELFQTQFAPRKPRRPGPRPRYSDSEVLTLAVLAQYRPDRSERAFLRYVAAHWAACASSAPTSSASCSRSNPMPVTVRSDGRRSAPPRIGRNNRPALTPLPMGTPVGPAPRCGSTLCAECGL